MNKKLYILTILFLLSIFYVNAILYVSTDSILYKASDDTTFISIFNISTSNILPLLNQSQIKNIATSDTDTYLYIIAQYNTTKFFFMKSSDNGNSFVATEFNDNPISMLKTSDSGQYIVFSTYKSSPTSSKIYLSNNYGASFTQIYTTSDSIGNFDMSDDGKYITYMYGAGNLYAVHSGDYGDTFTTTNVVSTPANFFSCATVGISQDGQYQFGRCGYGAGFQYNFVYSDNYGGNWSYVTATAFQLQESYPNVEMYNNEMVFVRQNTINYQVNFTSGLSTVSSNSNYLVGTKNLNTLYTIRGGSLYRYDNKNFSVSTNQTQFNVVIRGISYNSNISIPIIPLCIDAYNLCNNPLLIGSEYYCDISDTTYCDMGCINTDNVGACNPSLCTNECNILGEQVCDSTTSFSICGNYDTDSCLEYNTGYGCLSGQVCQAGQCVANTGTGLTNNTGFTVTPYSISDSDTVYVVDTINKKVTIDTANAYHVQGFSINTNNPNTYSSRTCDYTETVIDTENPQSQIVNVTANNFNTVGTTSKIFVSVLPINNVSMNIAVLDSIGNVVNNITILRNSPAKSICAYNQSTQIYCDYSINSYDDLLSVDMTFIYEFQSKTFTITFYNKRAQSSQVTTQPQLFTNNDLQSIAITSLNGTYISSTISTITQPNGFSTTLRNNYDYLTCTYSTIGCRNVRTYNNNNGISDFSNYYDYQVCINTLGNSNPQDSSGLNDFFNGGNLSAGMKYLIVLIALIAIIGGFTVAGFSMQNASMGFTIGVIIASFALIMFTVFGWIPAWILVFLILMAIATIILVSYAGNRNSGAG